LVVDLLGVGLLFFEGLVGLEDFLEVLLHFVFLVLLLIFLKNYLIIFFRVIF
jgi:hypothetical protein